MSPWLILLIIVIVIFIAWWALLRNAKTYKPDFEMHEHEEEQHTPQATTMEVPASARTPEAIGAAVALPDDLTIIEGIGPKVNQLLQAAGIQTFAQLAEADVDSLKSILSPAGLQFIDPGSWAEQARLVSEGRMEEFEALASRLKAGKKIG